MSNACCPNLSATYYTPRPRADTMKRIEHLLRTTIGLDAESIGSTSIRRVVRLRMKRIGLSNPEDYEQLLERSRAEWNEFVESVIVRSEERRVGKEGRA